MTKKIFISYKREDRKRVKELAENLRRTGNIVWLDESIQVGDHWWNTILEQIEQCDIFLFAMSQVALRSIPCQKERAYADELGKPLLLIQVGLVTAVPTEYSTIQYNNFSKGDPNTLFDLIGAINRLPSGQPNNPNVVRPKPPIPPIEELAAIIDTQAKLDFKDQAEILLRLQDAIDGPQVRNRALELVEVLAKRTEFVKIQEDCRAIIAKNKKPNLILPLGIGGLIIVGVVIVGVVLSNNNSASVQTATLNSVSLIGSPTSAVVSTQTATINITPSFTNTPRPTPVPTATSILASDGIKTTFVMDFTNSPSKFFTYVGYGSPTVDAKREIPISSNKIIPGMGILLEFQVDFHPSTTGDMYFWLESGEFGTTSYMSWDLWHDVEGWRIVHEAGKSWLPVLPFNFFMQKDKWYYLLWRLNQDGKLDTLLWAKDSPSYILSDLQRSSGTAIDISGRSFIFTLNINTADVKVARYEELQFPNDYIIPSKPPISS